VTLTVACLSTSQHSLPLAPFNQRQNMIAYGIYKGYKSHKAKKEAQGDASSTPANNEGAPPSPPQTSNVPSSHDHQESTLTPAPHSQEAMGLVETFQPKQPQHSHVGFGGGQATKQAPVMCPVCRQERQVAYNVREGEGGSKAVFATCLTCETTWKCQ
jgi:DNA-directed RNA polymerase subunit M/transcription elongation factor TFIIS